MSVSAIRREADSPLHRQIGSRVRDLMFRRGITQSEMAPKLRVSESVLSRMMYGRRDWTIPDVCRAAEVLGVSVEDIVQWSAFDHGDTPPTGTPRDGSDPVTPGYAIVRPLATIIHMPAQRTRPVSGDYAGRVKILSLPVAR